MREVSNEELKQIQMDILNSIHVFCTQHGLRYSLAYGTLIGAVRHKGFIPWDDDIDIMMPRPDYERFRNTYPGFNPHYSVQSFHVDDAYWFSFIKVLDTRTLLIENETRNCVYVDVFPVDGFPENHLDRDAISKTATSLLNHELRWATKEYKVKTKTKDCILHYLKYQYRKLFVESRRHTIKNIDELFLSNSFEDSLLAGLFFFDRLVAVLPRTIYEHYKLIEFEGASFCSIENIHEFLECVYGDYMKLPPEEQRVGRHNVLAYWL